MLDAGVTIRLVLAWAAWAGGSIAGIAGWLTGWYDLGNLGIVLVGIGCTLLVLHDNSRTRKLVRRLQRDVAEHSGGAKVSRVP